MKKRKEDELKRQREAEKKKELERIQNSLKQKEKKSLLSFEDIQDSTLKRQETVDTNYSDDEFYDDDDDDFEEEEEEENNTMKSTSNVDLTDEMERAKKTEISVNRQNKRLQEMEESINNLTQTSGNEVAIENTSKQEAPTVDSGAFVKPTFGGGRKSKKKKKYY